MGAVGGRAEERGSRILHGARPGGKEEVCVCVWREGGG